MNKELVQVDWNTYKEVFPDRYLKPSIFDQEAQKVIDQFATATVLEVGGGKEGTNYLKSPNRDCWTLDPYVSDYPLWHHGNLDYVLLEYYSFDIIFIRGAFNYLAEEQIKLLVDTLHDKGVMLFNTFYKPPLEPMQRRYTNSLSNTSGVETAEYDIETKQVRHTLEPDGSDHVIHNIFYYYSIDDIVQMLGAEGLKIEFTSHNSLFVQFWKN